MGEEVKKDTITKAYARWAPVYDVVFGPVFEHARRRAIAAAERTGGRILEVGVGTGLSLPYYTGESQLVGVDLSEPMLRKAHARVSGLGLRNVEGLLVMDAQKMAFPDNSFDVIVAQYVVTTVPDPEAALDEFIRVLRPGGEIVLVSRIGADRGLRRVIEKRFTPITRRLGWRLEFPWARYASWAERKESVRVVEHTPLAPFGHFSLIRFAKTKSVSAVQIDEDTVEAEAAAEIA
ncbi:MAG: class I SAM-dependent methyltransferase [Methylocapsa sp.]|nr:class I SAM-dependent methyltransferase [Methylocapsa sp.]